MDVDFGVEVSRAFDGRGRDRVHAHACRDQSRRPSTSDRPIKLADANAAIEEWCVAHDRSLAGVSWEIYGDPGDDPATLEVQVFYLLA